MISKTTSLSFKIKIPETIEEYDPEKTTGRQTSLSTFRSKDSESENLAFLNKLAKLDNQTSQMKKEWKENIEKQKLYKMRRKRPGNSNSVSLTVSIALN
jgi:hypothetical protein